jgi:hypothetical protein
VSLLKVPLSFSYSVGETRDEDEEVHLWLAVIMGAALSVPILIVSRVMVRK